MDVRTGGTYVWNYTGPDGGTMTLNGEYVEVDAPNRIVHRENWGPDLPSPLVEVTFADADGSTLMTVTFTFADKATRDHVANSDGLTGGYDVSHPLLDALLTELV